MTERDDAVSRRYRELPAEEPARALDEKILAASRRALGSRPAPLVAPTGRQRWYVPLAAAAVIVLAVGLTLRVQLERPEVTEEVVTPPSPTVLKAPAPKDEAKPMEKPGEKLEDKAAKKALPERRARGSSEGPAPFPAQPASPSDAEAQARRNAEPQAMQRAPEAPAAAAAPAPKPAPPPAAAEMRAYSRGDDAARDRAEGALASGATAKRLAQAEETPEKMLERIAELRKSGKHDEADKALAEFRKRFPDYKLTDEMRSKVERR